MDHDVFISYAVQDRPTAEAICTTLEQNDIRCWIAPRDILPGVKFGKAIIDAISHCRVFVLVLSAGANESPYVPQELRQAFEKRIVIIPFRIEEVFPSEDMILYLDAYQWLDAFTPPFESHLQKLTKAIRKLLTGTIPIAIKESPMEEFVCSRCSASVDPGHVFCPQCGRKVLAAEEETLEPEEIPTQPGASFPKKGKATAGTPEPPTPPETTHPKKAEATQPQNRSVSLLKKVPRVFWAAGAIGLAALVVLLMYVTSASYHLRQGLGYLATGRFEEAISSCSRALAKNPALLEAYTCRGKAYLEQGRSDEALADFNRVLSMQPDSPTARKHRALAYRAKSKFPEALNDLNEVLRQNPNDGQAYFLRGGIYQEQGNYELAVADYREALKLAPDLGNEITSRLAQVAGSYYARADEYSNKGKYPQAIAEYNKAIDLSPRKIWYFYNDRGVVYAKMGRYPEAIADLDRALEIDKNSLSYWNKAAFCEAAGRFQDAAEAYKQFIIYASPEYAVSQEHYNRIPQARQKIKELEAKNK